MVIAYPHGGVELSLISKIRYLPENQMSGQVCRGMTVQISLVTGKEIHMQDRKCSKCGSVNVYKNVGNSWLQDGVVIQTIGNNTFNDLFQTIAFLCLDCRNLEIEVLETTTLYGKQKTLAESIQTSRNWIKAS
jgi:hypothetical protein